MCPIKTSEPINQQRRRFFATAAVTITAGQLGIFSSASAQSSSTNPASVTTTLNPHPGTATSFASLKQVNAGLLDVGYAEAGPADGPAVILLHGWPYDIHSFVDVVPLLASAGYRVIVPYQRGYGTTRFLSDQTLRNGQQAVCALDVIALMDALKIKGAVLGSFDIGSGTADVVVALWPERCKGLVPVSGYAVTSLKGDLQPQPPKVALGWWYQYYFATDIGKLGYSENRHDFNKLIWMNASPGWHFDDATFDRTAQAFNNPDHVDVVINHYRWRLNLVKGEPKYEGLEQKLAALPVITVPTIIIASDFDGPNTTEERPRPGARRELLPAKPDHRVADFRPLPSTTWQRPPDE